jgi:glucosylceramidase
MVTAAENPDGTIAVVVFNEGELNKKINLTLNEKSIEINIKGQAIQTILISTN